MAAAELAPLAAVLTLGLLGLLRPPWPRSRVGWALRVGVAAVLMAALSIYGPLVPAFIHPEEGIRPRVFGIGLSRTGTTSLAAALRQYGYKSHHAVGRLLDASQKVPGPKTHTFNHLVPKVNNFWAEAFDAQTDILVSVVFEQLAEQYPEAIFILTKRNPRIWAKAAHSFFTENSWVWQGAQVLGVLGMVTPLDLFRTMYGDFESFTVDDWQRAYTDYEKRVYAYFEAEHQKTRRSRLHEFDVTKNGYLELSKILQRNTTDPLPFDLKNNGFLPRVYVFNFTFFTQTWWQVLDLFDLVKRELQLLL